MTTLSIEEKLSSYKTKLEKGEELLAADGKGHLVDSFGCRACVALTDTGQRFGLVEPDQLVPGDMTTVTPVMLLSKGDTRTTLSCSSLNLNNTIRNMHTRPLAQVQMEDGRQLKVTGVITVTNPLIPYFSKFVAIAKDPMEIAFRKARADAIKADQKKARGGFLRSILPL